MNESGSDDGNCKQIGALRKTEEECLLYLGVAWGTFLQSNLRCYGYASYALLSKDKIF